MKPGRNIVNIVDVQLGKSKNGTPELAFVMQDEHGDVITHYRYLSEKAQEHTFKELAAMGWDPHDNAMQFSQILGPNSPLCKQVTIEVEEDDYTEQSGERKSRLKVKWIVTGGGTRDPMTSVQVEAFERELRSKFQMPEPRRKASVGQRVNQKYGDTSMGDPLADEEPPF